MKRIAIAAILLAGTMMPALSHDEGGGGGGGGAATGLTLKPFSKGANVASGFVNKRGRRVLAMRKIGSGGGQAGAKLKKLDSDLDGETFHLDFEINPNGVMTENNPRFVIVALDSANNNAPYTRIAYLPLGSHVDSSVLSGSTTTEDGWKHYHYGHHDLFNENGVADKIGHEDLIQSITLVYDEAAPKGSSGNTAFIDNVQINDDIAIEQ